MHPSGKLFAHLFFRRNAPITLRHYVKHGERKQNQHMALRQCIHGCALLMHGARRRALNDSTYKSRKRVRNQQRAALL